MIPFAHQPSPSGLSDTAPVAVLIAVSVICLLLAGILATIETAFSRLSRAAAEDLVEEGRKRAPQLVDLLAQRRRTALTLRTVRMFVQVIAAVGITLALVHPSLRWWLIGIIAVAAVGLIELFAVVMLPVPLGTRNPERMALVGTPLASRLVAISHIADPIVRFVRKRLPQSNQTDAEARQEMADDLREMVDQVGETEGFEEEDREMLRSVFELGNTVVREVMVPRTEMITATVDLPASKALRLFIRSGFSRLPVIGEDIDDVRGILYFKDVISRMVHDAGSKDLTASHMMRQAVFTVETKPADDLLHQMQAEHFHMALVVDEYGGISGLVTLEDLIEEVVGEVTDEHDRREIEPEEVAEGVWRVPSRFPIDELGELFGMELEDDDVDSVGGLLTKAIDRVPLPGARGEMDGIYMLAEEARGRRRQVGTVVCALSPLPTTFEDGFRILDESQLLELSCTPESEDTDE